MRNASARNSIQRRAKLLTLLAASAVTSDRALATCDPTSPVNNTTVTCTGATVNQNGAAGYGSAGDAGNTYNIQAAATVEGTSFGVLFHTGATFNNSGTIIGTLAAGIAGSGGPVNVVTVNNASTGVISGFIGINVSTLTLNNAGQFLGEGAIIADLATVTNQSTGLISGVAFGIDANRATVDTSGAILATGATGVAISARALNVINRATGTISGGDVGISAIDSVKVDNAGSILAAGTLGNGIKAATATVNNSGAITANAGVGIRADLADVNNSGTIFGRNGLLFKTGIVTNSGTISTAGNGDVAVSGLNLTLTNSGVILSTGVNTQGIDSDVAHVNNTSTGTISGGAEGIHAGDAIVINAGTIKATGGIRSNGEAIRANTANVDNAGIREASGIGGFGIFANTIATVTNRAAGIISVGGFGVNAGVANVDNAGTISGGTSAIQGLTVTLGNSGAVNGGINGIAAEGIAIVNNLRTGTITGGEFGIIASVANVTNTGVISGDVGIRAADAGTGSAIDNAGTIIGTGGTAIQLTSAADTLTLRPGSRIVGVVDMGFGNDVVNVALSSPNTRVSTLTSINLPTFINFTGVINTTVSAGSNSNPSVVAGTTLATLDPTALALADRALMDFTGGVSSLVQGRLNGVSATSNGSMMAMAYAPESDKAGPFTKAPSLTNPAPITVWANSFGGQRTQDETAATLRTTNTAWSGAIGIDRKVRPDWLAGVFIGGGSGRLAVDLNSQQVDTEYVFAGAYSRFEWAAQFFDFTVQGGSSANKSSRLVLNNGAQETANATYNGWYISPELAYGIRYGIGNGYVLTPTARVRYVAGFFDGYPETRSAQGLTVGSRTLQNFEERGELEVSKKTSFFGGDHILKTSFRDSAATGRRCQSQHRADRTKSLLRDAGQGQHGGGRVRDRLRLSDRQEHRTVRCSGRHCDVRPEPHCHRQGWPPCHFLKELVGPQHSLGQTTLYQPLP